MSGRSSRLQLSIRGDELEQDRIQLEHNLQDTDLSLHLSSSHLDDYSDVEYPRHNSVPSPLSAFASFEQRSADAFDPTEHSHYNAWSIRSFNDDNTVNPYDGGTVSTAAHHASALTLNAGLGGRAAIRRDVSLSGAEYDPDRPIQGIMASMNGRTSTLQVDTIKSKAPISFSAPFDPLVVDDTAELDRVLQSGHTSLPASSLHSSSSSSATVSDPPSPRPQSPSPLPQSPSIRPKLSDALDAISFSPKRPRSSQSQLPRISGRASPSFVAARVYAPAHSAVSVDDELNRRDQPTPRSRSARVNEPAHCSRRHQQSLSYVTPDVEVKVHPATPSSANRSKFTKLAYGLAQEIAAEQSHRDGTQPEQMHKSGTTAMAAQSTVRSPRVAHRAKERNPFKSVANQVQVPTATQAPCSNPSARKKTPLKGRLYLPDVTGLTSAVISPAKARLDYHRFAGKGDTEAEARLFATLNAVQSKLAFLESENSVSRRRVHELELELEACKHEVARERTKVLEREEFLAQHATNVVEREKERLTNIMNIARQAKRTAQTERRDAELDARPGSVNESRYKEAVEEKKALEALITTLRNHLTRLTRELADHQRLLSELRSLRETDARALTEKSKDVDKLRQEVERLAGEVEVLRGVVEEGLKERRVAREHSTRHEAPDDVGEDTEEPVSSEDEEDEEKEDALVHEVEEPDSSDLSESEDEAGSYTSTGRHVPARPSAQPAGFADKTLRTDQATLGSSLPVDEVSMRPFVGTDEFDRISADLQDRRLERSVSMVMQRPQSRSHSLSEPQSRMHSRSRSPTVSLQTPRVSSLASVSGSSPVDDADGPVAAAQPDIPTAMVNTRERVPSPAQATASSRPTAPTPAQGLREVHSNPEPAPSSERPPRVGQDGTSETPFPQIRGARLERLFFSAPEHNAQTCAACHRRLRHRGPHGDADQRRPFWSVGSGMQYRERGADDEGFAEGSEDDVRPWHAGGEGKGKEPQFGKLPPQTVLSRVIRELEDDFTHYKSIYVELADQYKLMDAASNVVKRNVVAGHLREVIDTLEQKGDQIASLYDLLTFKDKPTLQIHERRNRPVATETASWGRARGVRTGSVAAVA